MSPAAPSSTSRALTAQIRAATTCMLSVGAGGGQIAVYLLDGHLVGASARDDILSLIERLERRGALSTARSRQLRAMATSASTILGDHMQDPILGLLCEEVAPTVMEPMLLERFEENVARFIGHSGEPTLWPTAPWVENLQIGHDTDVLLQTAAERWRLAQGLDDRILLSIGSRPASSELERQAQQLLTDAGGLTVGDMAKQLGLDAIAARASISEMIAARVLAGRRARSPHSSVSARNDAPPTSVRRGRSILSEDDLSAFSGDADHNRGVGAAGGFSTQRENLDRVEILHAPTPRSTSRAMPFSAPVLSDEDAFSKVDVANDVLQALCSAMDSDLGASQGRSALQVLIDGRPRAFIPLLEGIRATKDGALPRADVLTNVRKRPAAEQRRLLKQGLLDLLDRALDKAADVLSDEAFDALLQRTVGYRQRMGL